jgi:hypothetical protein
MDFSMNELKNLGQERATARFPELTIKPIAAWWSGGTYRLTMDVDNRIAVGTGKSMNECCDNLIKDIESITSQEYNLKAEKYDYHG